MGLFGKDPHEARLREEKHQAHLALGMAPRDAKRATRDLLNVAIAQCKRLGVYKKPTRPRWLFESAKTDPDARAYLEAVQAEGVTDADIETWHGVPHLERAVMSVDNDHARMMFMIDRMRRGFTSDEATQELRRFFPMWGDPRDSDGLEPQDRLLPVELSPRFWRWQEGYFSDPDALKERLAEHTSYNALIRAAIADGEF